MVLADCVDFSFTVNLEENIGVSGLKKGKGWVYYRGRIDTEKRTFSAVPLNRETIIKVNGEYRKVGRFASADNRLKYYGRDRCIPCNDFKAFTPREGRIDFTLKEDVMSDLMYTGFKVEDLKSHYCEESSAFVVSAYKFIHEIRDGNSEPNYEYRIKSSGGKTYGLTRQEYQDLILSAGLFGNVTSSETEPTSHFTRIITRFEENKIFLNDILDM